MRSTELVVTPNDESSFKSYIEKIGQKNLYHLHIKNATFSRDVFFSYETPVAFVLYDEEDKMRNKVLFINDGISLQRKDCARPSRTANLHVKWICERWPHSTTVRCATQKDFFDEMGLII